MGGPFWLRLGKLRLSPDLNPIEQVFAKLKHFVQKAAARTVEAVCLAIGEVLQLFTSEECTGCLQNSNLNFITL
jgi:transposase